MRIFYLSWSLHANNYTIGVLLAPKAACEIPSIHFCRDEFSGATEPSLIQEYVKKGAEGEEASGGVATLNFYVPHEVIASNLKASAQLQ